MDNALVLGLAVGVLGLAVNLHGRPHVLLAKVCYAVALGLVCSLVPGLAWVAEFRVLGTPIVLPLVFAGFTMASELVRRAPAHVAVSPEEWRQQEERFNALARDIEGFWSRKIGSSRTSWQIQRTDGATKRDLQAFGAEARNADELLRRRMGMDRRQFTAEFGRDPIGRWLNAGIALGIDPDSSIAFRGRNEGVDNEGGTANDLAGMSALACKALATGSLPKTAVEGIQR